MAHKNGEVLVIATERAPRLVSCNVHGEAVYYVRMHDQTLASPEFLVADILLGKRQFPYLSISDMEFYGNLVGQAGFQMLSFGWYFAIENEGFLAADNIIFGFIHYGKSAQKKLNQHLRANIEIVENPPELSLLTESYNLVHVVRKYGRIDPFEIVNENIGTSEVPIQDAYRRDWIYTWNAAFYVIAQDAPPIWYQISMDVNIQTVCPVVSNENVNKRFSLSKLPFIKFERVAVGKRPLVGWESD